LTLFHAIPERVAWNKYPRSGSKFEKGSRIKKIEIIAHTINFTLFKEPKKAVDWA
jgi:hypothetical protein